MHFAKKHRKAGESTETFLAIRLKSISMAPRQYWDNLNSLASLLIDRQMDILRGIHGIKSQFTLDLRYINNDEKMKGIEICYLIKVATEDNDSKESDAEKIGNEILRLLTINLPYYYFEKVADKKLLEHLISPFQFNDIVELTRRDDAITLDQFSEKNTNGVGFNAPPTNKKEKAPPHLENIYYVYPFSLQLDNMERLCNIMLVNQGPSMLSICLRQYELSETDDHLLNERVRQCEKFSQLAVGLPPSGDTEQIEPILQAQARALLENCSKEYLQLQDAAFLLKIQIVSDQQIQSDLVSTVGASFTEHSGHPNLPFPEAMNSSFSGGYSSFAPASKKDKKAALDNLKYLEFTPWCKSDAGNGQEHWSYLFNVSQACTAFRLPLPTTHEFPGIDTLMYQPKPAPNDLPESGVLLGENIHLSIKKPIYQAPIDRLRHTYVIGQTGTGKSTLFRSAIIQDIHAGHGIGLIDPHGELIEDILKAIPPEREEDVILFDPLDFERPIGLNFIETETDLEKDFCINYLIETFDILYDLKQTGGPIFEQYMRNALQLLLEQPPSIKMTVLETVKVFQDYEFRDQLLITCTNPYVVDFWKKEAEKAGGDAALANVAPYITSKLNRFIYNNTLRRIVAQPKSGINFREAMDKGKILLVDLRKGLLGETNSHFIGMLLVGKLFTAALSRTGTEDKENLKSFYLYVDEFQNLATPTFVNILSEARKYKLSLTVTNQYISQLPGYIIKGLLGNVGTLISFRVGSGDAELLAQEFSGVVSQNDLIGLPNWHTYVRLQSQGNVNAPFDMKTLAPETIDHPDPTEKLRKLSHFKYGREKDLVEYEIRKMSKTIEDLANATKKEKDRQALLARKLDLTDKDVLDSPINKLKLSSHINMRLKNKDIEKIHHLLNCTDDDLKEMNFDDDDRNEIIAELEVHDGALKTS